MEMVPCWKLQAASAASAAAAAMTPSNDATSVLPEATAAPAAPRCRVPDMLQMISDHDCWVFDLDGTIWRGDELIPGAVEVLELLRSLGKQVLFMTNNSMKSRSSYLQKLQALGIQAHLAEVYCSSYSAAAYLESISFDRNKKVYVVGEAGIMAELAAAGFTCFGGPEDNDKRSSFSHELQHDPQVNAVVCGVDPGLSYYKIQYASLCLLQNPGCLFIATNSDSRGHFTPNQESPGAGATVGAIAAVVERQPVITGKPSPFLMSDISAKHNVRPERSLMVGDRLDTDVLWGCRTGMDTLLVLTGVTDDALLATHTKSGSLAQPHYVLDSLSDLLAVKDQLLQQQV